VTAHPLDDYKKILEANAFALSKVKDAPKDKKVKVGGIIAGFKKIITKTGRPMLFLKLEDLTDRAEIVVFPAIMERNPVALQENKIVFIKGRIDNRNGETKIIADDVEEIINS
ncbi:MAG: OB-fold nucleic acid binding domain-containing protein, partial [Candidatus Nealsonbacteria bacterium]|nr:OB-fold nucleic acid binding domain-containing protein [Candidatus Nealsonbacteria bacterium]